MIVCSLPRCGATKLCLDLSKQKNLEFVGELNPTFLTESKQSNQKDLHHETKFQPEMNLDKFLDVLYNHENYVVLVNHAPHYMIPQCDLIILRKKMRNSFLSTSNFLIKMYPDIKVQLLIYMLNTFFESYLVLRHAINKYDKPVVWYEEYYGDLPTVTPILDSYIHKDAVIKHIEQIMRKINGQVQN